MADIAGAVLAVLIAVLLVGALTGRVGSRGCCAADPRRDLRMRAAWGSEEDPRDG